MYALKCVNKEIKYFNIAVVKMDKNNIAIFPLKIVLFPDSVFPLHIFEDRYKMMINNFLENGLSFGMNFHENSKSYEIGCEVRRIEVIKRYDDGRLDITITGGKRYKINHLNESPNGYLLADIEYFDDEPEMHDDFLLDYCLMIYNEIAKSVKNVQIKEIILSELPTGKPSFYIAQKSGLTHAQKQLLLEARSENKRLKIITDHLNNIFSIVKKAELASVLIKNDGYFTLQY